MLSSAERNISVSIVNWPFWSKFLLDITFATFKTKNWYLFFLFLKSKFWVTSTLYESFTHGWKQIFPIFRKTLAEKVWFEKICSIFSWKSPCKFEVTHYHKRKLVTEAYLELSQTSKIKFFHKISQQFSAVNYFCKKLHRRLLTGFSICLWVTCRKKSNFEWVSQ